MEESEDKQYWQDNIAWLLERFPNGEYKDVIGLCKAEKIEGEDGIKEQDYSLNPGRYVGVVIEEDGLSVEDFKQKLLSINSELSLFNSRAKELEKRIADNIMLLVSNNE